MKIKNFSTTDEVKLRRWMKEELFDWHNQWELIGMVKDKGMYEVFYKIHEEEDNLL